MKRAKKYGQVFDSGRKEGLGGPRHTRELLNRQKMLHDLPPSAAPVGRGAQGDQGRSERGQRCYLADGAVGARAKGEAKAGPKGAGYLKCGKKKFSGGVILDFAQPTFLPPPPPRAGQKPTHD